MNNNIKGRITPLLISLGVIVGILIGTFCTSHFSGNRLSIINTGTNKLSYLLQIIDNNYVILSTCRSWWRMPCQASSRNLIRTAAI